MGRGAHKPQGLSSQLGPQQLRYMALRSDSSAPAARAPASAAAWGASPASLPRAPAPAAAEGALSRCARTAATVAAAHTRLMGAAISSETTARACFLACATRLHHSWLLELELELGGVGGWERGRYL